MLKVSASELKKTLEDRVKEGYTYLVKITAADYPERMEVLYFIRNIDKNSDEVVCADLNPDKPHAQTVIDLYPAADWYERELSEMFGIAIDGREVGRLLLEKWDGRGAPMRKEFVWGKV